ncbi:MAG: serine/threonine protein kinase, partial [Rhodopirellula sp. JB044]|uniref:serine/threonine protein kinase n=1 Tax=Rhodopirellula sp. JB044 TaxID=3342844 RepID=UPI00370A08F4
MNIRQKNLPVAVLQQIDDKCEQFETALQKGDPISIESVLADVEDGAHRQLLLAELVALEIDYRTRSGESPSHEEYNDRFPEHTDVVKEAFAADKQSALPFAPPSIDRVAKLFPSLQVIELLGAGGMGAVYRARQPGLDRDVALKLLPEEFHHDPRFSLRFTREARALAKLNHPNIVSVYEFGNIGDAYYFLMEYVDGTTLRSVVQSGELAPEQALAIVPQLCDALQYAHDQRVIHRDIKPENILLSRNGEVKIVDFGLSRIIGNVDQTSPLTATNQVMGTPRYMAPEQYDGVHNVDHRADIYSLGVVFYELLTGELPLGRFAPPSKKVAIDVRLDEVVLRSLEKEPRFRYQAASDVKSDLQSIANSDDIPMAVTLDAELSRHSRGEISNTRSGERSGPAARMLLDRRNLMGQVQASLRPLFAWQTVQLLVGIALVALGAFCWTRNVDVPHRLVSGVILHVYGVVVIAAAIAVMVRIKRVDYFQPIERVQERVSDVQSVYLRLSPLLGFPWWLMWIPAGVAAGFDQIMHPNSLFPSLVVGCAGIAVSLWAFYSV